MTTTRCDKVNRHTCGLDHCVDCNQWHLADDERQTCIRCLGATRRALIDLLDHAAMLPDQAINGQNPEPHGELKIPGGDALALMVDGSNHVTGARARYGTDPGPARYSYPSDPNPPANLCRSWEDDWRHRLNLPAATSSTLTECVAFLSDRLVWAAQHHPAWPQFSHEIRAAARALEQILHAGLRDEVGVPCIRCDQPPRLRATYADPDHEPTGLDVRYQVGDTTSDRGGRRDYWQCPKCHEVYSPEQYLEAQGEELARQEAS